MNADPTIPRAAPVTDGRTCAWDDVQRAVITATESTLLLGSAGTGKSTTLIHATAALAAARGAESVVAVAPDRSTARSWQGHLAPLVAGSMPVVTTMASLAADIVAGATPGTSEEPPRVLTAPEQEVRVRELLEGTAGGPVQWPAEWKPALATRSFARLVRRCLAQARRTGWEPDRLRESAVAADDAGWVAVADFLAEYLDVLDWEGAIDYAELGLRALRVVEARPHPAALTVVLDDAHHLDPVQARLITALTAGGGILVAAADPDQCIGSYRGADLRALSELAQQTRVRCADRVHRGGSGARDARDRLMGGRWYAGLPAAAADGYRTPAVVTDTGPDALTAVEFDDPVAQVQHLAAALRSAHRDGVAWRDMAVLVTRPGAELPTLVRGLAAARIPLHVPVTDVPLAAQPAVATLLAAAEAVVDESAAPAQWGTLACSDMMALPAREWRALQRVCESQGVTVSELMRDPVAATRFPAAAPGLRVVAVLERRLATARRLHRSGAAPAEVLWALWHGGDDVWPERLRRRALGNGDGAIAASRDLDSVIQLLRLAERAPERWGGRRGLRSLLDEIHQQEIAAEPDLSADSGGDNVSVLSLHRSPGRSWAFVVVTGLTESAWSTADGMGLIDPGRLTVDELLPAAPRQAAAERRRLLTVALGRSSDHLLLCAAGGADDPPTSLLDDAGIPVRRVSGRPEKPQTAVDLVLRARRELLDDPSAAAPRDALHRLTALRDHEGRPAVPGADPRRWAGVSDWTVGPVPLRRPDRPLSLSASGLALLDECPLRWLLQREARGDRQNTAAADFGLIVHEVAAALAGDPHADPEAELERAWSPRGYDADWYAARERDAASLAVGRAAGWLATRPVPVRAEHPIDEVLAVRGDSVRIRGSVDVVEAHDDHVQVWDHKTRRSVAGQAEAENSVQLAVYQWAVGQELDRPAAGAGLIHLCVPAGARQPELPKVRHQSALAERAEWIEQVVTDAASAVRTEQFPPRPGTGCRTCPFQTSCPAQGAAS